MADEIIREEYPATDLDKIASALGYVSKAKWDVTSLIREIGILREHRRGASGGQDLARIAKELEIPADSSLMSIIHRIARLKSLLLRRNPSPNLADVLWGDKLTEILGMEVGTSWQALLREVEATQKELAIHKDGISNEEDIGDVVTVATTRASGSDFFHIIIHLPFKTKSAEFIITKLLPPWIVRFLAKNADYGDQHRFGLGVAAEFVGVDRKMSKLEAALWHSQEMNGEDPDEMLDDQVGQIFLIKDLRSPGNWTPSSRVLRKRAQ